ncbi:MAG TPA: hypothetical protein VH762_02455 [Gemmatimonadaceae bacterium]|jgi:hypothetical protein
MYWISDEQRTRALTRVAAGLPSVREQLERARVTADRRRRVWYAGFALLVALIAAIFN